VVKLKEVFLRTTGCIELLKDYYTTTRHHYTA